MSPSGSTMRRVLALVAACFLLSAQAPACAEGQNAIEKAARQMGADAREMSRQAGDAGKKAGKDIANASTRTARSIKQESEDLFMGKGNKPPAKQKVDRHGRK